MEQPPNGSFGNQPPPQWQQGPYLQQPPTSPFPQQFPSGQYPQQPQPFGNQPQFNPQQPMYPYQQPYGQQSPFMQLPVPAPKKKRGKGLLIGSIALIAALLLCVVAGVALSHAGSSVSATPSSGSTKVGNVNNVIPTAVPTQASAYKVGDVVKVGNAWSVTITSAQASNGDATYQPESGKRSLVLNLSMVNLTNENHTISSLIQFTLRSDDGTKYDVTIYPSAGSQIDGDVNGGQPAKGVIVYSIPTNVSSFHLTFESNPMEPNTPQATWNLKI